MGGDFGNAEDSFLFGGGEFGAVVGFGVGVVFAELFGDGFGGGVGFFFWGSVSFVV